MAPVLPTTQAGAERAVLIAFVGWRVAVLGQMLPAVPAGIGISPHPNGYLVAVLAVFCESVAACVAGIQSRRSIGAVWTWFEVAGGCVLLLATPLLVPPEHRIGSWIGFAPGLTLALVGMAGAGLTRAVPHRWWQLTLAALLATGCYLVSTVPSTPEALTSTVVGNALTYPSIAVVVGIVTAYLRRMATDADAARRDAADAAELAERRRNQLLLHDSAGILQVVATDDTTPELGASLRQQAAAKSARIRAFLDSPYGSDESGAVTVTQTVHRAIEAFQDLPIGLVLDLGGGTRLTAECGAAVHGALRALLHNVRAHARARSVVIHADSEPISGEWELSVRDDGCGYDMLTTPPGFGLVVQVHHALAGCGIATEIHSVPGEGTVAVLRGRSPALRGDTSHR